MTYTISRRFQFCAGHRVPLHESKCWHPHGHNYVAHVFCEADNLDAAGRVVDFSVIKEKVGAWIDDNWDHGFIRQESDEFSRAMLEGFASASGRPPKTFAMASAPTAENLARVLFNVSKECLSDYPAIRVVQVILWETENCAAYFPATTNLHLECQNS